MLHFLNFLWSPALVLPVVAVFYSVVLSLLTKSPAVAAGATCLMVQGLLLCFAMVGIQGYGPWGWGSILLSGAAAWGVSRKKGTGGRPPAEVCHKSTNCADETHTKCKL